jgi:hypothetical protein
VYIPSIHLVDCVCRNSFMGRSIAITRCLRLVRRSAGAA